MTIIGQERIDELKKLAEKDMSLMTPEAFRNSFNFSWEDVAKFQEQQQGQLVTSLSKLENKISRASLDMSLHGMGIDPKMIDYAIDDFKAKASKLWEATVDKMCNYQAQKYDKARDKIKEQWKEIAGADFPILKTEDGKEVVFSWYRNEREGFFYQQGGDGPARISPDIIKEMDSSQLKEISDGFRHGFTKEQIEIYANPEYNSKQMQQLREGLEKGLDVSKYANPAISHDEMMKIRETLSNTKQSPPIRHVGIKSQLTNEVNKVEIAVGEGVSTPTQKEFGTPTVDYSKEFSDKMTNALLKTYEIYNKLGLGTPKELLELAQQGIEMNKQGLPVPLEMVAKIDTLSFNDKQIEQINMGLNHGLSSKDVAVYADPKIKAEKMEDWRKGLEQSKLWRNKEQYGKPIEKNRNQREEISR